MQMNFNLRARTVGLVLFALLGLMIWAALATGMGKGCTDMEPVASHIELKAAKSLMREVKHIKLKICLGSQCDMLDFSTRPTSRYGSLDASGVSLLANGAIFVNLAAIDLDIEQDDKVTLVVAARGASGRVLAEADEEFVFKADDGGGCYSTRLTHHTTLAPPRS
jgi:hypothetical protein